MILSTQMGNRYAAIKPTKNKSIQLKDVYQLFFHEESKIKLCDYLLSMTASVYPEFWVIILKAFLQVFFVTNYYLLF